MTPNTPLIDPDGRECVVITGAIPGRVPAWATVQYEDGRAALVDLALCKPVEVATP